MALLRHIALLAALVIATIAVSLTPSSVQAPDGRGHAAASTHAHASEAASVAVTAHTVMVQAEARIDCAGPCCTAGGHHGSCCCATGLAPEGVSAASSPMASARSLLRGHASPDGIVPEALPEPPRPFA